MDTLKKEDGSDLVCWHGTCADFDIFYPLSHFAVDKIVSDCAEFYEGVRRPPMDLLKEGFHEKYMVELIEQSLAELKGSVKTKKIERHPNFKIIPAHLKMKNPLWLTRWGFDLERDLIGLVWALQRKADENSLERIQKANVFCDFIFKNSQECSHDELKKELKFGHLFAISDNEEENRFHLTGQRLILFLENLGYDGIQYDNGKNSVDAYRMGKVEDFDNRAYVIFRPEQVVRLDKKVDVPCTQSSIREKIELNKIFYHYKQGYRPYKISERELWTRLEHSGMIKNRLHCR